MAMRTLTWRQVAAVRMRRQHLVEPAPRSAMVDVVRDHVGIQAQVASSAELALRARVADLQRDDVRDALWRDRSVVKTWAMRGTLHLVAAAELPELVRGLGTRLNWLTPVWLRYFEVTKDEMVRLQDAIGALLSAEPMTRQELGVALAAELGNEAFAERVSSGWGTFLKPAAGRGWLAFGPDRGRNVTFVHPEAWLGVEMPEPAPEGVDAVLVRHLAAFPGSTKAELGRWWGAPVQVNAAVKRLAGRLETFDVEGTKALALAEDASMLETADEEPASTLRLLGGFDPYTLSLQKEAEPLLPLARRPLVSRTAGWISAVVLAGGAVAGTWTHESASSRVTVAIAPWRRFAKADRATVEAEAARIGAFLSPGAPVVVRWEDPV